ncbi:MAG: RadC family protein [Candidatus Cryptobacteroides sp.]|jgi:DNA repair protein RadC
MKIKDLCAEERPREKMFAKGVDALSNAELLAILIGSGTGSENVLEVANKLLSSTEGKLAGLASMDAVQMRLVKGIGPNRYATIAAALELGKRYCLEDPGIEKVSMTSAEMIYRIMIPRLKNLDHEECWIIFLNRANYILHKERMSIGGTSATIMDTRLIVKKALDKRACGIILVHNHPSGNPRPGRNDLAQTEMLKKAADTFDISLMDHIIVCNDRFFSFAEDKMTIVPESSALKF